jgi:UDP-2,3-diacylglucosamine pyrophosphatase LpxH
MRKEKIISQIAAELINLADEIVPRISPVSLKQAKYGKGDEEVFVLLLSDFQIGIKTSTYNTSVFEERFSRLTRNVLKVLALHRRSHPVKKLVVFLLGDLVHNEEVARFLSIDELEVVVHEQVFRYAIPVLQGFFVEMLRNFEKVEVYCVRGNHGQFSKLHATTTNLDDIIYHFLKASFSREKRIKFNIAETFYQIAKVYRWKFLLVHGDTIRMHYQIPWYGITTRVMRWQNSIEDFNFVCMGHFHSFAVLDWGGKTIIVNGTFLSDDDWSKQRLGLTSSVCQVLLGVHPKRGISFIRKIFLTK